MNDCTKSLAASLAARDLLVQNVAEALNRLKVGPGPLVVAVSGGPDSVALIRVLKELQPTFRLEPLILAHLNHQLRGRESDADESFVGDLARSLQELGTGEVQFTSCQVDVRNEARLAKDNLEKTARELRYAWLVQVAKQERANWIVTGHTGNDQAETVLHRLLRGCGLKGLRGIASRRRLAPDIFLARPFLAVTRTQVMAYLQTMGQDFRQDSSNLDRRLTRNRIRHELLPQLEKEFNPAVVGALCHLAEQAERAYHDVEKKSQALLDQAERPRAGPLLILDCRRLTEAPRSLVREVFRRLWTREAWPLGRMGFFEWDRLAAVAFGELTATDLPGGVHVVRQGRVMQIERGSKPAG
jgi:tRNA(Ile)-lysidine synthase